MSEQTERERLEALWRILAEAAAARYWKPCDSFAALAQAGEHDPA